MTKVILCYWLLHFVFSEITLYNDSIELCEIDVEQEARLLPIEEMVNQTYIDLSTCIDSSKVRLTDSRPSQTGSFWYDSPLNVMSGFTLEFTFNITGRSHSCMLQPQVTMECSTRGGEGFAFVLSGSAASPTTRLGKGDGGLGYDGIPNGVALEFDTINNNDNRDLWHNHVSLHTSGKDYPLSARHDSSIGYSTNITDFQKSEAPHTVKIIYESVIDADKFHPTECRHRQTCGKVMVTQQFTDLHSNGSFPNQLGAMEVYYDNLEVPLFVSPIRLDTLLDLHNGVDAYFGFTGSTSELFWQKQDILNATFCGGSEAADCIQII